jgi:quercetin dioxygenase-like cupin family protein
MSIQHFGPNELIDVSPLQDRFSGQKTSTLFKSTQMEVIRMVLPAGKMIAEHKAPGDISVHCLEGRVEFTASGTSHELSAGRMLYLQSGTPHSLKSLQDCSLLLTIVVAGASK